MTPKDLDSNQPHIDSSEQSATTERTRPGYLLGVENNNSGCQVESPTTAQPCQAQTLSLWQVQPGFWYRFYKGSAGTIAMGMSYSYTYRSTWAGLDSLQPKGIENIVMTSFRYYFP